jgi:hypothetical protein
VTGELVIPEVVAIYGCGQLGSDPQPRVTVVLLWYIARVLRIVSALGLLYPNTVTSVADPCLLLMDPDPDPAIFVIELQDVSKKLIF